MGVVSVFWNKYESKLQIIESSFFFAFLWKREFQDCEAISFPRSRKYSAIYNHLKCKRQNNIHIILKTFEIARYFEYIDE